MRSSTPALFPVFRSPAQAEILAATLLNPDREQTISDLSRLLGIPMTTVSDEVARLIDAQILISRQVGRAKLVRASPHNRLVGPLTEIALATMGPHLIVRNAFAGIPGIERLLIFGSWAARYHGQPGPPPTTLTSWLSVALTGPRSTRPLTKSKSARVCRSTLLSPPRSAGMTNTTR